MKTNTWKIVKLKSLGKCCSGGTPDSENPDYWNGDIYWCTPTEITALKSPFITSTKRKITDLGLQKSSAELLPINSVIVCTRATIGDCAINKVPMSTNQGFKSIIPNEKVDYLFLYYLINYNKKELLRRGAGSTFLEVSKTLFEKITVLIPVSVAEQRKIAEILGTCDRLLELTEQLITAKRKLKRGLMQKLLTGKLRFPEFEGQKWKTVKLGKLCNIRRGASPRPIGDAKYFSETGRGWIRIADVTACQLYLRQTSQYLSKLGEEKSVKVNSGDLIMSICGTIGVCRIVDIPACIHDGFVLITPKNENINSLFLLYFLNHIANNLSSKGQPGTQKNLNTGIVSRIEIPDYLIKEQIKIKDLFLAFDKEIDILEKRLNNIQDIKKGVMQQLLTGKTRVKID